MLPPGGTLKTRTRLALALAAAAFATQAAAQVVFYEREGFEGRSFTAERAVRNFERSGFNDRASSAVVLGGRWEVCEHAQFGGKCIALRPGRYGSLAALGMNDRISSVRAIARSARVDDNRYAPEPVPVYDNRRRGTERLFEADVTSVRAVVGPPQQRCWTDHQPAERGSANVPGAVVGALLGGVLGHQVGSGRGNDAATAGGAIAGGLVGANVGRGGGADRDVQRCETTSNAGRPEFFDVTYNFRGQEHRMQTASPPGRTVTVNERGEPRA